MKPSLSRVLRAVNRGRVAIGRQPLKKMPKGYKNRPGSCPLANALRVTHVGVLAVSARTPSNAMALAAAWGTEVPALDDARVYLPPELSNFVCDFDDGAYPELIAGGY